MASSAVEICNEALALVGAAPITSLAQQTTEAQLLNSLYVPTRDQLLTSHPWNFATKRVELAADPDAPEFGFAYRFALPADCLRVISTDLDSEDRWKIENGYLLCDSSEVSIRYISKITTEATFSINFCEALAYKLASKIAYPLVQSSTLAKSLFDLYITHLRDARSMDAQEGGIEQVEANEWINSRY
jgi:hypothetical protein